MTTIPASSINPDGTAQVAGATFWIGDGYRVDAIPDETSARKGFARWNIYVTRTSDGITILAVERCQPHEFPTADGLRSRFGTPERSARTFERALAAGKGRPTPRERGAEVAVG